MPVPWFILTATTEIRLDSLPEACERRGFVAADSELIRGINTELLEARGISSLSPLASPSFRPDAGRIVEVSLKIERLVKTFAAPEVVAGTEFPLVIEDWATARPAAVFCLTSQKDPEHGDSAIGKEPPACRRAFKIFHLHRLATSGIPALFLNVGERQWPEISAVLANVMSESSTEAETEIDLGNPELFAGGGGLPAELIPFRVLAERPLDSLVLDELEQCHQRRIRKAAVEDQTVVFEKSGRKLAG